MLRTAGHHHGGRFCVTDDPFAALTSEVEVRAEHIRASDASLAEQVPLRQAKHNNVG